MRHLPASTLAQMFFNQVEVPEASQPQGVEAAAVNADAHKVEGGDQHHDEDGSRKFIERNLDKFKATENGANGDDDDRDLRQERVVAVNDVVRSLDSGRFVPNVAPYGPVQDVGQQHEDGERHGKEHV